QPLDTPPGLGLATDEPRGLPAAAIAPADLLKSWGHWTATVECFALGRRVRRYMDRRAFETLRGRLLATCQEHAADDGPERALYGCLGELVTPWVSLRSLAREAREILRDLLARCPQVERVMGGRPCPSGAVDAESWLAVALLALTWAFALFFWSWLVD